MKPRDVWDPERYERFKNERTQPFFDLLELVEPRPDMRIIDLGSGTGELTRHMHDALQAAETLGIERSGEMFERAAQFAGEGLHFLQEDLCDAKRHGTFDLVFSNAVLHWVEDHPAQLRTLAELLRPSGQLAVQLPANHFHPSHTRAAELAAESPFRERLDGFVRVSPVLEPEAYAEHLTRIGFRQIRCFEKVYEHRLPSREGVVDWVKGTTLTAYSERLSPEHYEEFLTQYRERLLPDLADEEPYRFPFRRIFFYALAQDAT